MKQHPFPLLSILSAQFLGPLLSSLRRSPPVAPVSVSSSSTPMYFWGGHLYIPPVPVSPAPIFLPIGGIVRPPPPIFPLFVLSNRLPQLSLLFRRTNPWGEGSILSDWVKSVSPKKAIGIDPLPGFSGRPSQPGESAIAPMAVGATAPRMFSAVPLLQPPTAPPSALRSAPVASSGHAVAPLSPSLFQVRWRHTSSASLPFV